MQYISPDEVAALVDDPGQLTGLIYDYNQTSLEGIGQFTGLERLELHGSDDLTDIKDLASLKNFKVPVHGILSRPDGFLRVLHHERAHRAAPGPGTCEGHQAL